MVMFDSLNRHMLPPYGGDWTCKLPGRIQELSVTAVGLPAVSGGRPGTEETAGRPDCQDRRRR